MKKNLKCGMFAVAFPPNAAIGMHRSLRLANYLAEQGAEIRVYTLTLFGGVHSVLDQATLGLIHPKVKVVRIPPVHPIKRLFLFRDKYVGAKKSSDTTVKLQTKQNANNTEKNTPNLPLSGIKRFVKFIDSVIDFFATPDVYSGWALTSFPVVLYNEMRLKSDVLFVSGPPWTPMIMGAFWSKVLKIPLVVDFRDPWTLNPYLHGKMGQVPAMLEKFVLNRSSRVIVNTQKMRILFENHYPELKSKIDVVYNGVGQSILDQVHQVNRTAKTGGHKLLRLSHVGTLYSQRMPPSLITFLAKLAGQLSRKTEFKLSFIGKVHDEQQLVAEFKKENCENVLEFVGQVPHHQAISLMAESSILLLIQLGTKVQLPGKIFEYAAVGKPILSLCEEDSETFEFIKTEGIGFPWGNFACIDPVADWVINSLHVQPTDVSGFLEKYHGTTQAAKLVQNLEIVLR